MSKFIQYETNFKDTQPPMWSVPMHPHYVDHALFDYRINNKVYTRSSNEFSEAFNKAKIWASLVK